MAVVDVNRQRPSVYTKSRSTKGRQSASNLHRTILLPTLEIQLSLRVLPIKDLLLLELRHLGATAPVKKSRLRP